MKASHSSNHSDSHARAGHKPEPGGRDDRRGLMHKVGKSTVITQSFFFYPDLSDTGQYRGTFNFGIGHQDQQVAGLAKFVCGYF